MRLKETPWGAARFAWGYLGALVVGMATGLLALIGSAVAGAIPACRADRLGFCVPRVTVAVAVLALAGGFLLAGYLTRLGPRWALWCLGLGLVLGQVIVETELLALGWVILALPAGAVALSFERPDRELARWCRLAHLIALGLVGLQFLAWLLILMLF